MKEKKEFALTMKIPKDATNIDVGKKLEQVFLFLLSKDTKAIVCKICPNEKEIYIKPFVLLKLKEEEVYSKCNMTLKDEKRKDAISEYSFMLAETIIDIWNKFMTDEFYLKIDDKDKYSFEIGWNQGMTDEQLKAYWFSNSSDGYNVKASFWTREWLKEEHKKHIRDGGKIN